MSLDHPSDTAGLEKYLRGGFAFEEHNEVPYGAFDVGEWAIRARSQNSIYVIEAAGIYTPNETKYADKTARLFKVARFSEVHYMHGEVLRQANEFDERTVLIGPLTVGRTLFMFTIDTEQGHWSTPLKAIEVADLSLPINQ